MYFKKDNVFVNEENVCYREKCKEDRKTFKKRAGKAGAGRLRCNFALCFCGLLNSFLKCLLNHLDLFCALEVQKASWLSFADNSIGPNRRWSR